MTTTARTHTRAPNEVSTSRPIDTLAKKQRRTGHTPEPWRVKDNGSMEGPHVYGPVHPVDGGDYAPLAGYKGGALTMADARLIASAPELLDALHDLIDQLEGIGIPDWHGAEGLTLEQAKAALAKATGEVTP